MTLRFLLLMAKKKAGQSTELDCCSMNYCKQQQKAQKSSPRSVQAARWLPSHISYKMYSKFVATTHFTRAICVFSSNISHHYKLYINKSSTYHLPTYITSKYNVSRYLTSLPTSHTTMLHTNRQQEVSKIDILNYPIHNNNGCC